MSPKKLGTARTKALKTKKTTVKDLSVTSGSAQKVKGGGGKTSNGPNCVTPTGFTPS